MKSFSPQIGVKTCLQVIFLLLSVFVTTSCLAEAKAFIDGKELLRLCDGAADSRFTRATDCLGYITGLSDFHEVFHDLGLVPRQWCWPAEGISNREMAAVVYEYLETNPTILDKSAALLSSLALFAAYPCK